MLKLAQNNFDDFLPHGKTAYLARHKYALQKAREAGKMQTSCLVKMILHKFELLVIVQTKKLCDDITSPRFLVFSVIDGSSFGNLGFSIPR